MKRSFRPRAMVLMLAASAILPAQEPAQKIDLRVLYAGTSDSPRTRDFTSFLSKTFGDVGAVELATLDQKAAEKYDVVIVDSPTPYLSEAESRRTGKRIELPKVPALTTDFTRPVVLMGAAGGAVLRKLEIKLDWL